MNSKQKSNLQFRISHPNYNKNYYEDHKEIIRDQQLKYYQEKGKYLKKLNYELNKEEIIKKNIENYYKKKNEKIIYINILLLF